MEMKREICEKCWHCLPCMCGGEFEDCLIKKRNLKREIINKQSQRTMTNDDLFKADADYGNIVRELVRVETKLRVAREIAEDFRENTSLDTIIRDYESRIKELNKTLKHLGQVHGDIKKAEITMNQNVN